MHITMRASGISANTTFGMKSVKMRFVDEKANNDVEVTMDRKSAEKIYADLRLTLDKLNYSPYATFDFKQLEIKCPKCGKIQIPEEIRKWKCSKCAQQYWWPK